MLAGDVRLFVQVQTDVDFTLCLRIASGNMCKQREKNAHESAISTLIHSSHCPPVKIKLNRLAALRRAGGKRVDEIINLIQDARIFCFLFDRLRYHHNPSDVTFGEHR